jgi:hypothetical protein
LASWTTSLHSSLFFISPISPPHSFAFISRRSSYTWKGQVTPWNRVLVITKNFSSFYETLKVINVFIKAYQWTLCWARWK